MQSNIVLLTISNNLFLVLIIVFLAIIVAVVLSFLSIFSFKNKKIRELQKDNLRLIFGEKTLLSYKKIADIYVVYTKTNKRKTEAHFFDNIMPRVIYDLKRLKRYEELRRYMAGFTGPNDSPPILVKLHIALIASDTACVHVRKLCTDEFVRIKNMHYHDKKFDAVEGFLKELSEPRFVDFPQKKNKQQLNKLKQYLSKLLEADIGEKAINTFGREPVV